MLPIELLSVIIASVGNIFLGLFTFFKNPKSATGKLFMCFTLLLALYIGLNYAATHQTTDAAASMFVRVVMSNAVLINLFFYLLVDTFPQAKVRTSSLIFWSSIIVSIVLVPITYTFIFEQVTIVNGTIKTLPGLAMPAFLLHTLVYVAGGFLWLIHRYRKSRGIEKTQRRFFLVGTVFMFVSLLVTNLVFVVLFNNATLVGLLPLYTLVFVGCISYAMVRHRFLDINVLVIRVVVYSVLIAMVAILFTVLVSLVGRTIFPIRFTQEEQLILIVMTVVVSLLFQQVRHAIERITDRIFFKGRYVTNDVLSELSHIMASTLRLEDLTHGLLETLLAELRIGKGAIILLQEGNVTGVLSEGYDPFPTIDESRIRVAVSTHKTLNADELEEGPVKAALTSLEAMTLVHLRSEGKEIGILILGAKSSGDIYSAQDLSLLEILAPEAAVAVQNALSYEEIRRFSITLQNEVARATEDLRKANVRLQELDKLKDEFVSLASHELRTPLTAIRSYIWMALSGKGGELNEKQKYYLDRSFTSTNRLIKLVNSMLNISRIESGRMAISFKRGAVASLIQTVLEEIQPKIAELGLTVAPQVGTGLPDVIADPDKVVEVLMNFIGNAMKFTPKGGTITIQAVLEDSFVRISVTDTGVGIAKEDLSKLFTKFGALRSGATPEAIAAQSTGLGLYISKSIIAMHGGSVSAMSDGLGKGSTFGFTLPVFSEDKIQMLQKQYKTEGLGIIHTIIE